MKRLVLPLAMGMLLGWLLPLGAAAESQGGTPTSQAATDAKALEMAGARTSGDEAPQAGQGNAAYDAFIPAPDAPPGPVISLSDALRTALARNLSLLAVKEELALAEAKLYQAWALLMPVAQGTVQWMHMNKEVSVDFASRLAPDLQGMMPPSEPTIIQPQNQYTGALQARLPIINVSNWLTIGLGQKGRELAQTGIEEARRQVLFGVVQVYYGALMSKSLIALWEDSIRTSAQHLEAAEVRLEAGTGLRIDVARAKLDLETAKQSLITARLSYDNTRDALAVLLDMPKGVLPEVADQAPLTEPAEVQGIASRAAESRNDVKMKDLEVQLAQKSLDVVWMRFLPTLDFNWQLNHNFGQMSAFGSADRTSWATVMVLTMPIFEGFRYGMLDEQRAALRKVKIEAFEKRLGVEQEVRQAYRDFKGSIANVDTAKRQLDLAHEAMELAEAAYNAGAGTSLDLIDSQKRHNDAGINLATQRLLSQLALIRLYQAAGEDLISLIKEQ